MLLKYIALFYLCKSSSCVTRNTQIRRISTFSGYTHHFFWAATNSDKLSEDGFFMAASYARAWFMWALVSSAYALAFFQRVAPPAIVDHLMADFGVGASQIGFVTSMYFYGYMLMQFPAGVIVDRWGVRRAVLMSLAVSGIGTLWFTQTSTTSIASMTRVLIALGDALVFSSLIKLSAQWFPSSKFGMMSGLSQASGFIGGLLATTPLALLVSGIGWRHSFGLVGYLIIATFLLSLLMLRDLPAAADETKRHFGEILVDAARAMKRLQTWGHVLIQVGTHVSIISLSGAWGIPLFMQAYGLSRAAASMRMFVFMIGYTGGSIAFGYWLDTRLRSPRAPLMVIGALRIILLLTIAPAIGRHIASELLLGVLLGLGLLTGGTMPLLLTSLKQLFTSARIATAIGLMTTIANLAAGFAQLIWGMVLDYHWEGAVVDGVRLYTATGYTWLMIALAAISILPIVGATFTQPKS
jgi:sugar phosphate permease